MKAIGVCTCSGILVSTLVGIIFAPALYCVVERFREFVKRKPRKAR